MLCVLFWIFAIVAAAAVALKLYVKLTLRHNGCYACLEGKTVIVTGANAGIGYTTALNFAMRGARVVLACRDGARAARARQDIVRTSGNENVAVKIVDMQSLESVRAFAEDVNRTEERIDILVNNAAGMNLGDRVTKDGLQIVMQTNHFSSFLLTHLLLDKLKSSAPSRIVNVSSLTAKYFTKFDADHMNRYPEGSLDKAESILYANSKLCNIFFTTELAKKLDGTGVTVNCLHPGTIKTEIGRNVTGFQKLLLAVMSKLFFLTAEEGAHTTIYVALSKETGRVSGGLFSNCKEIELYKTADDVVVAKKVWRNSEDFVKLSSTERL